MAFTDIFNASDIKKENERLKAENENLKKILTYIGAPEIINVKKRLKELKIEEEQYLQNRERVSQEVKNLTTEFEEKKKQIGLVNEQISLKDYSERLSREIDEKTIELEEKRKQIRSVDELILLEGHSKKLSREIHDLTTELEEKKKQIISVDDQLLLEGFALYQPHFSLHNSAEYKNRLDGIRETQKQMIKSGQAATGNTAWTVNGSVSEGSKMVKDMVKLALRAFNNECDYCFDNTKFNNIETHEKRMNTSFDALNKLGRVMQVTISPGYKKLKFDELYLAFEYQRKLQEEKEEKRRKREELREQQKLEQEIKSAREKIAKERMHYSQAIEEINKKIGTTSNEGDLTDLKEKLIELQGRFGELEKEEQVIDYREKNAKAGYVYIISNIGSFGENIFKIGMTRRLEPLDRIYELGDASVPFPFDIHALIFSDNAPELEAKIQQHFHPKRLNKINSRKEFFRADVKELEKTVKEHYNKVVDFISLPLAEQYRESLLIQD